MNGHHTNEQPRCRQTAREATALGPRCVASSGPAGDRRMRTTRVAAARSAVATSLVLWLVVAVACNRSQEPTSGPTAAKASPPGASPQAVSEEAKPVTEPAPAPELAKASAMAHDPSNPPIDCPLRKQGIDPAHMKPFEDMEKYIAFLERPDRAAWQKPDEVVAALGLRGTETVVDLGAGSGYFTFRFAKALPEGKVVAADTEAEMVRHIHHRAMTEGVQNIEARLIDPAAPEIPGDTDLVFVCDVLHHVPDRAGWLAGLARSLRSGARFALIEFKVGDLPTGPPEAVKIPRAQLLELVTKAGFVLDSEHAELLPYQVFLVFRKP